jgi:hypothetical protein
VQGSGRRFLVTCAHTMDEILVEDRPTYLPSKEDCPAIPFGERTFVMTTLPSTRISLRRSASAYKSMNVRRRHHLICCSAGALITGVASSFDQDVAGAILEWGVLWRNHSDRAGRASWEAANLRQHPGSDPWRAAAVEKSLLL